ncbi:uncharacterized protein LOC130561805 [Triplophysa rosa]|uniref:Ig-like domain-containing protein n=1 Tax=Triplophysa rosa TaxID=992332 RepID=A0A9W7TRL8_TRIRA|nr:uncharacterized protein LOC130561805 [Triplophysa rosa]KAI7804040.1 hypothetical protein IRJ41_019952 [Triplophysa rosa]
MDVWKKLKAMLVTAAYLIILLKSVNGAGFITLHAHGNQMINCKEKASLQCNISSSMLFNILDIKWGKRNESFECDPRSTIRTSPAFECNYTMGALTLTILHPKPADMGIYFCWIRTDAGHDFKELNVSIEGECTGESFPMAGPEKLQCTFTGVYPEGTIHWFHNDDNVTSYSNITSLPNTDGTFNITSVLQLPHNEHVYNCFLMLPINGQYIETRQLALRSRINRLHCSWTLLLSGLMLRIFLLL